MLELRPNCECCDADLPASADARICSFECTYCVRCAEGVLGGVCPNCGGRLAARPIRPQGKLAEHPASTVRVRAKGPCGDAPTGAGAAPARPGGWIAPVTLQGRFVRLVPLETRHAADLFEAADPELFRHTPQHPPEWSVRGFELEIAKVNALANVVAFAIIHEPTGRAIGRTTYMDIRAENRGVEVGRTWIGRAHHGTVVNPEIKLLMIGHAFEGLSPPAIRVQLFTGGTNLHSQTAIAKLGAVREGTLRHYRIIQGSDQAAPARIADTVCFSILAEEWPSVKQRLEARVMSFGKV